MNTVRIGKEMKEGGFKAAYHSLPRNKEKEAREKIMKACYWKIGTFRMKLSGRRLFTVWEIREIEKFFAHHNLNAWTGEELN